MDPPNTDSARIMGIVDRMSAPMRALVYTYGFTIVHEMRAEGYTDAEILRPILESWRQRRQNEWLQTNYVQPRAAQSIEKALERQCRISD